MTKNAGPSSSPAQPNDAPNRAAGSRFKAVLALWRARCARFLAWAFCPYRRLLVKIVPHQGEAVYKLELSHRHLSLAVIAAFLLASVLLGSHVADVHAAEARARALARIDAQQRAQLATFSKETTLLWLKVGKLQHDDEEIHRLTKVIVPKSKAVPSHKTMAGTRRHFGLVRPAFWGRALAWVESLPARSDFGFEAEAADLSSLSDAVNKTGDQTVALEATIRAAAERKIAAELARERYLAAIPSIWPTLGYISSGFGYREYPDTEFHNGLDIVNDYGAPIYATAAGVIVDAGWYYGYGLRVVIDHGNGLQTWYGHASQILVNVGQTVKKGQEIALVGESGFATGPHCHYQIDLWGRPIDPTPYLNGSVTVVASN